MSCTDADCLNSAVSSFSSPAASRVSCANSCAGPRCFGAASTSGFCGAGGCCCARNPAVPAKQITSSASLLARIVAFREFIFFEIAPAPPPTTKLAPGPGRFQHPPYDLLRQRLCFGLQAALSRLAILLDISLRGLHLRLRVTTSFIQSRGPRIQRRFAPGFLRKAAL